MIRPEDREEQEAVKRNAKTEQVAEAIEGHAATVRACIYFLNQPQTKEVEANYRQLMRDSIVCIKNLSKLLETVPE